MKHFILSAVIVLGASTAGAAVLDFELDSNGAILNSFSVDGISGSIVATGGSGDAMVFNTVPPVSGGDTDLASPFYAEFTGPAPAGGTFVPGTATLSPGNVLIISEDGNSLNPDDAAGGGTITFSFNDMVTFNGFNVFDDVTNFTATANTGATTGPINLAYDNQFKSISGLGWLGVSSVKFDFGSASGAIDSIAFEQPTAVPVPASLPLLAFGLGAFGYMRRNKRRS